MIFEYALDPEIVCTWIDRITCSFFMDQFGIEKGRLVSRYPKCWKKLVWMSYQEAKNQGPHTDKEEAKIQGEKNRLIELLQRLSEPMIKRHGREWNKNKSWLGNTKYEHSRFKFHGILTKDNQGGELPTLTSSDIHDNPPSHWIVERGVTVKRKAEDMANVVSAMLTNCRIAIFVDPYFSATKPRYKNTLSAFLKKISNSNGDLSKVSVEVHCSSDIAQAPESDHFESECLRVLPKCIPKDLSVTVKRWKQKPGGEKLHNRYILTDIGGVEFGAGLDEGGEGETDDVTLLDKGQYNIRWSQYTDGSPAFDLSQEPFKIEGGR